MFYFKPSTMSVALLVLLLAACGPAKSELWEEDKALLLKSVEKVQVAHEKMEVSLVALDKRIAVLESDNSMLLSKVKTLEVFAAIQEVMPKVNQQRTLVEPTRKFKALHDKLDILSAKLKPGGAISPLLAEKDVYTAAYLAFKSGRFDEAMTGFKTVVKMYEGGVYTGQAYYWLGESLVALHRDKEALYAFSTVMDKYAEDPKHAAALLKGAQVYQRANAVEKMHVLLMRILTEHPRNPLVEQAKALLRRTAPPTGATQ